MTPPKRRLPADLPTIVSDRQAAYALERPLSEIRKLCRAKVIPARLIDGMWLMRSEVLGSLVALDLKKKDRRKAGKAGKAGKMKEAA